MPDTKRSAIDKTADHLSHCQQMHLNVKAVLPEYFGCSPRNGSVPECALDQDAQALFGGELDAPLNPAPDACAVASGILIGSRAISSL